MELMPIYANSTDISICPTTDQNMLSSQKLGHINISNIKCDQMWLGENLVSESLSFCKSAKSYLNIFVPRHFERILDWPLQHCFTPKCMPHLHVNYHRFPFRFTSKQFAKSNRRVEFGEWIEQIMMSSFFSS